MTAYREDRGRVRAMQAEWEFKTDPNGGGWYWICVAEGSISESTQRFPTPAECIADAERHGYSDEETGCRTG